jgi:hypothetical protein
MASRASHKQTSVGEAFRVTLAGIIFAAGAQAAIAMFGLVIVIALRHGGPRESDLYRVLLVSCLPWAVIAFQSLTHAIGGISGVFAVAPPPPPVMAKEDIRMIPVWRQEVPRYNGVDEEDLEKFIRRICETKDWRQRSWVGVSLPSGYPCDYDYHRRMVDILKQAGFITGHQQRVTGKLLCDDPEAILNHLGIRSKQRSL